MKLFNKITYISLLTCALTLALCFEAYGQSEAEGSAPVFEAGPPQPQRALMSISLPAQTGIDLNSITTRITKYPDFYRTEFESTNYVPFTPTLDGDLLTIEFQNKTDVNAALFGKNLDIVRAYGESDDGRTIVMRLSYGNLKLRRFIADNFTSGFDLFFDRQIAARNRNIIYKTQTVDGNIQTTVTTEQQKIPETALQPVRKFVPKNNIIVFPKTFIGPPAVSQMFKMPPDFIGPPPTDFSKNTIYEIERPQSATNLSVEVESKPTSITLKFPFINLTDVGAAALWQKGKRIILVFSTPINLDLERVTDKNYIKSIEQFPSKDNTILIIDNFTETEKKYRGALNVSVYKTPHSWNLEISQKIDQNVTATQRTEPLNVLSENFWGVNRVVIQKAPFQKGIDFFNDQTGEKLIFFPSKQGSTNITAPREFVDMRIFKSIQGAVVEEKSDSLSYDVSDNRIEIVKESGLILSDEILSQDLTSDSDGNLSGSSKVRGIFPENSILPFPKAVLAQKLAKEAQAKNTAIVAAVVDDENEKELQKKLEVKKVEDDDSKLNFYSRRIKFQNQLNSAPQDQRTKIKMDYATWLFERKLYPESKAQLEDIIKTEPDFEEILKVRTMRAATEFLMHHYQEAYDNFTKILSDLDNNIHYNEIKLWQWASNHLQLEESNKSDEGSIKIDFIASYDKFMQQYPDELRTDFGLTYVDDIMQKNQLNDAKSIMEIITYRGTPDSRANDLKFLNAKLDAMLGNTEGAIEAYEELQKQPSDRKNRAKAGFELIKQKLINNQITLDEATKQLEALSFVWRDDFFEIDLFQLIGQLYLSENRFFDTLMAWRYIATNFPSTADSIVVLGKMRKVFIDLFHGGVAYSMKPLETLNIYFTFQELMPVGELGDEISRKFADYLVKTDLPEDAIKIIEHQVRFRAEGEMRDRLALQLADMYIRGKRLLKVDEALRYIDLKNANSEILRQAKYRRAMVQALSGKYDNALSIIRDDFSYDAMSVRLELFWQRENWFGVINILENRLNEMNDTRPEPLTKKEIDQVLKLAVAYSAQEEFAKLRALSANFRNRMQNENDVRLLDFLSMGSKAIDNLNFEDTLQLNDIERFITEYNYLPLRDWRNVIEVLEPKVATLVGVPNNELTRDNQLDVIRLATAYALVEKKDERETNDFTKRTNLLLRDFKDVRLDRTNIDALFMLDSRTQPIEPDAIFEARIRLADLPEFIKIYQDVRKVSELNIRTRGVFKN
jgi:hypothetical protein